MLGSPGRSSARRPARSRGPASHNSWSAAMTATHGLQGAPPMKVSLDEEGSAARTVFLSKTPLFVQDARGYEHISQRVVRATGAVSMQFEPVLRNEETVAVLVVGWGRQVDGSGRIAASLRMLAAETA